MKIADVENRNLVAMVLAIDGIVSEMLSTYLAMMPAASREAACTRITAEVADNGRRLVELAPKQHIDNATVIQAASARLIKAALADAMATVPPPEPAPAAVDAAPVIASPPDVTKGPAA